MIAAALGIGLANVIGQLVVTHLQSNARSESLLRQCEDWKRATRSLNQKSP